MEETGNKSMSFWTLFERQPTKTFPNTTQIPHAALCGIVHFVCVWFGRLIRLFLRFTDVRAVGELCEGKFPLVQETHGKASLSDVVDTF